jgi:hypothetical protein
MELRKFISHLQTHAHHGFGAHELHVRMKVKDHIIELKDFNINFEEDDNKIVLILSDN